MKKVVMLVLVVVVLMGLWFSYRKVEEAVRFNVSLPFFDGTVARGSVINCQFEGIVGNFLVGFDERGKLVVCLLDGKYSKCKVSADVKCNDKVCILGSKELEEAFRYAEMLLR